MGKPTICIGENKDADHLRDSCEADQRLFFATRIEQFLFYLNPKFQASSFGLCPTCSKTTLLVFPRGGSFVHNAIVWNNHNLPQECLLPRNSLVRLTGYPSMALAVDHVYTR